MADRKEDLKARLLATFRVEAEEHLQAITAHLLALDRGLPPAETREVVETLFREVHTLKGAARSVSLLDVEAICQACESLLSRITRGELTLSRPILNGLHDAVAGVARLLADGAAQIAVKPLIERLEQATAEPAAEPETPLPTAPPPPLPPTESIRVATAKLDAVLLRAEDLLVPKLAAQERVREARALLEALLRCRKALGPARIPGRTGGNGTPTATLPSEIEPALREAEAQAREVLTHLLGDQRAIAGAVDGLLDELRRLRMMPASTILDLFPRMVLDLAREHGKEVEWAAQGADLEVDRRALEAIKGPLIHLVRNAVDHGIESPRTREEGGKPPVGRITVSVAALEGSRVEIRVEDDGAGIDPVRVRAAAVRARLLMAEEAEALPDDEVLNLIFRSGLSTSPIITDVSGHGLGLAIVKERVEQLGGRIQVETRPGQGTTVRMLLPATIATFRGLQVRAGGQTFLLSTDAIERVIRVSPAEIERIEGREAIRADGYPLSVAPLGRLLRLPDASDPPEPGVQQPCVVVTAGEERAGLLVDEILEDQEVLVKEFRPPLVRVKNVAGTGLLGTGQVVPVLRPADLLRSMRESPRPRPPSPEPEEKRPPVILVVDDSITTRTMERNLLEGAGYQVRVAVDGLEAWTLLKSEQFDLVVSDVDMPRLDGLDLTARIRADKKLADLPVVLVTALESREDKERGIEVGANAYIVKSSFDQSNLLEIIRRLA